MHKLKIRDLYNKIQKKKNAYVNSANVGLHPHERKTNIKLICIWRWIGKALK